jgi:hypothetical protein
MKATSEFISPEQAAIYLDKNYVSNRKPRPARVDLYAAAMAANEWHLTGEPVIFDIDGNMVNGQHRMLAAIKADTGFLTLVVRGAPSEAFTYLDSGLGRQGSDVLHSAGIRNATLISAAARLVVGLETGTLHNVATLSVAANRGVILDEVMKREDMWDRAALAGRSVRRIGANPSAWAAFYVYASDRVDEETISEFLTSVIDGANLPKGDPRIALRSWFANAKRRDNRLHLAAITRAWNAWANDTSLTLIKTWITGQPFPALYVP